MRDHSIRFQPYGRAVSAWVGRRPGEHGRDQWSAGWIAPDGENPLPGSSAFRLRFELSTARTIRLAVTADAVYRLYADGVFVARGPEQGDAENTFVDSFAWDAAAGPHTLVAVATSFGAKGPYSRMPFGHGFLLAAEAPLSALLDTGVADWEVIDLPGHQWRDTIWPAAPVGQELVFDAAGYPVGVEHGAGDGWTKAVQLYPGRDADTANDFGPQPLLRPATLPPMLDDPIDGFAVRHVGPFDGGRLVAPNVPGDNAARRLAVESDLRRGGLRVPPHTRLRVLLELDNYYCLRPELTVSGGRGAELSLGWCEALALEDRPDAPKGDRRAWENRYFHGVYDHFRPDGRGGMAFYTLAWRAGRFASLEISTGDEALTLDAFVLRESRYPLRVDSRIRAGHPGAAAMARLARRTLEMCAHDTFMDCPFYEQLQYLGDTRIQALLALVLGRNEPLVEKALRMFAAGQRASGFFPSRYPSRVTQIIPTFSPFFIGMLEDYARWRGGPLVRELLPAARRAADAFEAHKNADGLVELKRSWNFVDWTDWPDGVPPQGEGGVSGVVNALHCYGLASLARVHELAGEVTLAGHYRKRAARLEERIAAAFWRAGDGLFADTRDGADFSEHMQALMLLSETLPPARAAAVGKALSERPGLTRCAVYFLFYLFEAYRKMGRADLLERRMAPFREMPGLGLATLLERPEPSRSDCHAWSAHALYHLYATQLGVRPLGAGFRRVEIRPLAPSGRDMGGAVYHPSGGRMAVTLAGERAEVVLPPGLSGVFVDGDGTATPLGPGRTTLPYGRPALELEPWHEPGGRQNRKPEANVAL